MLTQYTQANKTTEIAHILLSKLQPNYKLEQFKTETSWGF